jgi:hypothetical protein
MSEEFITKEDMAMNYTTTFHYYSAFVSMDSIE